MKQLSMPYTESQITLHLSGYEYFAFENCAGYHQRSAHQLGEMDVGWYEPKDKLLYIAELKDYTIWLQTSQPKSGTRIVDLFHKSLSVIAMITAIRSGNNAVSDIDVCLPSSWPRSNPVHLLHIIHCAPDDEVKMQFMNDKLKEFMKDQYLKLFNITNCTVLSHRQAIKLFPGIIT